MRVSIVVAVGEDPGPFEVLLEEIEAACQTIGPYEVICVDDAWTEATRTELTRLASARPSMRLVRHAFQGGKSAALWTGVQAARASVIATLDDDGRNDPAALPRLVSELVDAGPACGLVAGQRLGRHDSALRRFRSKIANSVRSELLGDGTRDSACGLKCFPREVFLRLPYFDGLHMFLPALIRSEGYAISLIDVMDRPSRRAQPEKGLLEGVPRAIADLIGVRWLISRRKHLPPMETELGHADPLTTLPGGSPSSDSD